MRNHTATGRGAQAGTHPESDTDTERPNDSGMMPGLLYAKRITHHRESNYAHGL